MITKLLHKIKSDQKFKNEETKMLDTIYFSEPDQVSSQNNTVESFKVMSIWSMFENVVDEVMFLTNLILWKIIFIHYSLTHMYKPTVSRFSKLYIPNASNKYILYQILRWVYIVWDTSPLKQKLIIRKIPNILSMSQATRI